MAEMLIRQSKVATVCGDSVDAVSKSQCRNWNHEAPVIGTAWHHLAADARWLVNVTETMAYYELSVYIRTYKSIVSDMNRLMRSRQESQDPVSHTR